MRTRVQPTSAALTGSIPRRATRLLWRGMRAHPWIYTAAVGASALFGTATVLVSRVLGAVTDRVVVPAVSGDPGAQADVGKAGLVLAAVALALAVGVAGRRVYAGMGYAQLQADHRSGITRQYLRLPMSWHRRHPTGQLLSHASSDVEAATSVFNPCRSRSESS
ncbi:ABC transporter transmembrane domain-containing protein [Cellulomonas soli]